MSSRTASQKQSSASRSSAPKASTSDTSKPSRPISDLTAIKAILNKSLFRTNYDSKAFPSFSTLFPESPFPEITSDQSTDDFESILKSTTMQIVSSMKKILKEAKLHVPRIPQEIFLIAQELALHAMEKPGKPKKATAAPALSQEKNRAPATSAPKDKQTKPSSAAPRKPSAPTSSSPTSRQKSTKKAKLTKDTTESSALTQPSASDIMAILNSSVSPQFAYKADQTPSFTQLFPNTSVPSNTMKSGFTFIDPVHLKPLLQMRLNAAKTILRKNKINVSRLPSTFVRSQIRLISASVHKLHENKRSAKKEKSKRQKAAKNQLAKTQSSKQEPSAAPRFVQPSSSDSKAPQAPEQSDSPQEHPLFSVREKKLRMRALVHTLQCTVLPNRPLSIFVSATAPSTPELVLHHTTLNFHTVPTPAYIYLAHPVPLDLLSVIKRFRDSPSDFSGSIFDLIDVDGRFVASPKTNLVAYLQALDDVTSISASALF